ncbi:MAG: nitrile hydratase accessory protein [Pseudomonadota bacterium]
MNPAEAKPFDAPWQAQAFALVTALIDAGVFTASDWAEALGQRLAEASTAEDGTDYYDRWLLALEDMIVRIGLADVATICKTTDAWRRAAAATPHGHPITLDRDPCADA